MLGHDPVNTGVSGHMTYDNLLVIHQVLAHALIRPIVDELLESDIIRPIIWIVHQNGLLDVVGEVATLFDLCKSVVKGPTLGQEPERIDKMTCISLNVEIMSFPKVVETRQIL